MRILVVDDDHDVRSLVVLALGGLTGHEVVAEAGDAEEAVRHAEELQPDVIVTDLVHSSAPGSPPVLTRLREAAPDARLIVFSGMTRRNEDPMPEHADEYVVKGGRLDPLLAAVERATGSA
jgi:DNA-binding NarL/FixJ family response regulator